MSIEPTESATGQASRNLTKQLVAALSKCLAEIQNPAKDSINPHFKSKYADLASVVNITRASASKNGLAFAQTTFNEGGQMFLQTILMSEDGGYVTSDYPIVPTKNDPQGIGSALTYARRYALCALFGIAGEDDDDGQAASRPVAKVEAPQPKTDKERAADWLKGLADTTEVTAFLKGYAATHGGPWSAYAIECMDAGVMTLAEAKAFLEDGAAPGPETPPLDFDPFVNAETPEPATNGKRAK